MGQDKDYLVRQITSADPTDRKSSVRFATTVALSAYTRVGNTIQANANGAFAAQDGVTPVVGDAFLLTSDGSASDVDNGIWVITQLGSGGAPYILDRRSDANASDLVNSGLRVAVEEGTQYLPGTEFVLTTPNPIVLNTTDLEFVPGGGGGNGSPSTINTIERIPEGRTMVFADDLDVEDGELDVEGNVEDIERFENHSIVVVPIRTERVVQKNEVMFFTELTVDGTLTIDGDIEDISPAPPPAPPTVGELGGLVITDMGDPAGFPALSGKLYRVDQALNGEVETTLPASPTDGDTIGFYIVAGFVELSLEFDGGANSIAADGHPSSPLVDLAVDGGNLVFVSWNAVLGQWNVYGAMSQARRLGGIVQTTDATPATAATYPTLNNNKVIGLHVDVIARDSGNELIGHWVAEVTAKRDGAGVVAMIDSGVVKVYKDNANWDIQFNVSGQDVTVDVIGDAGNTVEWRVRGTVIEHG